MFQTVNGMELTVFMAVCVFRVLRMAGVKAVGSGYRWAATAGGCGSGYGGVVGVSDTGGRGSEHTILRCYEAN